MDPILPPELERKIFELAVGRTFRPSAEVLNLMLVAHRTHQWCVLACHLARIEILAVKLEEIPHRIAAMMYGVVKRLGHTPFPTSILPESCPSIKYYGPFVKRIILGGDMDFRAIMEFLSECPNLIDIALWSPFPTKDFVNAFATMQLQRLSANLSSLDGTELQTPTFFYLTHLDVTKLGPGWTQWKALTSLPRLTHLAINEVVELGVIRQLLRQCSKLRILLIIDNRHMHWNFGDVIIQDYRLVMMKMGRYVIEDWEDSARSEKGMWSVAEEISLVKQRITSNNIDRNIFTKWFKIEHWKQELEELL